MITKKYKQPKKTSQALRRPSTKFSSHDERNEPDSTYLLKLVLYVLLGTFWIKLASPIFWQGVPLGAVPVGLLLGLVLVKWFEKYQTDRKIWYAILIVVTILGYFVPAGIVI